MTRTLDTHPRRDGYRMPGEFEPHAGCWMLWPERPDNWRLGAKPAQQAFTTLASAIAASEPVTVGVSAQQFANARRLLPAAVRVVELSSNDAWMRDVGPTFVVNDRGGVRGVDWQFNAWGGLDGGLYFPWDKDDAVAQKVLEIEGCERYRAPFILEGGAIHVDGQGTLITTEECLLNPNRNPGLTRAQIETLLQRYLNIDVVVWLDKGVHLDETDGHVDNICAFVRPGEVVLSWTRDKGDPQYAISRDAYERLMDARDARGRRLKVHKLQQPGPLFMTADEAAGVDAAAGSKARPGGRPPGGVVRQFLPRYAPRRRPAAGRASGWRGVAQTAGTFSQARSGRRAGARAAAGRRQCPLRDAAGPAGARPRPLTAASAWHVTGCTRC
jgi:agmatine deiminase